MNFYYQPIKNRDEKPRDLSKALGIRPPTFGSRSEKDTIAILAEKFHECGCFSAQSMGNNHACRRITERPLWGTSHPGVQQDAADAKLIWEQDVLYDISHHRMACKVTLTLLGWFMFCTYMAHEIYIYIYIYRSQVLRTSQAELCNSNFANSIRVNDLRPQNQLQTGPDKNNNERIKKQITGWNLFTCFYVAENFIHVCSKLCLSLPLFLLEIIATKRKMFTPKSP